MVKRPLRRYNRPNGRKCDRVGRKWSFVDIIGHFVEKNGHLADCTCDMKIAVVYL